MSEDTTYQCICDCGCFKNVTYPQEQCNHCDNGIHYDDINKEYVNYNEEK